MGVATLAKDASRCEELRAKVAYLSEEAARCGELDSENRELRTRIASLSEEASLLSMPEAALPEGIKAIASDLPPVPDTLGSAPLLSNSYGTGSLGLSGGLANSFSTEVAPEFGNSSRGLEEEMERRTVKHKK